ncbi:MAG: hypothetical protein KDJ69_12050 [Nitratireductor sp.]|nr:hypothetical protein [Nitratireductor sp.]
MFWLWGKILGFPTRKDGKTGSRELAVTVAMFTIGLIFYWGGDLSADHKRDILFYLIVASVVCLMAAFGMKALAMGLLEYGKPTQQQEPDPSAYYGGDIPLREPTPPPPDERR